MAKRNRSGAIAHMVKSPTGVLATTRGGWASKRAAIDAFLVSLTQKVTWKQCYARGWRVVFVDIRELAAQGDKG